MRRHEGAAASNLPTLKVMFPQRDHDFSNLSRSRLPSPALCKPQARELVSEAKNSGTRTLFASFDLTPPGSQESNWYIENLNSHDQNPEYRSLSRRKTDFYSKNLLTAIPNQVLKHKSSLQAYTPAHTLTVVYPIPIIIYSPKP
jgi:hypothetical protein